MIRPRARPLAAVALALALGAAPSASAQTKDEELRALRARVEALKKELAAAESARAEAVDVLRDSESAISESSRALRELGGERARAGGELARIGAQSRALEGELAARRDRLARALAARYVAGEGAYLRVLASGDDPNEIARRLVYQTYLARAQADLIARTRADLARLAVLETASRERAAAVASVEQRARAERDALVAKAAERRAVLARHALQIRKQRRDLESAQHNESRLARIVAALARPAPPPVPRAGPVPAPRPAAPAAPATGEFGALKGRLPFPVRGELVARFGASESAAAPSAKGVFIRAPAGADVKAVAPGRVVFADWMRGYGNLLILDHGDGYLSIYGNNESVLRRVGDEVHAGEAVAIVGASGGGEASGLYFETRFQGRPFDPVPWLRR